MLIDNFINAIYLYDDKLVLTFNYKDGTKTITFEDVRDVVEKAENGSDLACLGAPNNQTRTFCRSAWGSGLSYLLVAHVC